MIKPGTLEGFVFVLKYVTDERKNPVKTEQK